MSRQFVEASAKQLQELCERRLEKLALVALLIDGIHFGGQVLVVASGLDEGGVKHVLGLWQGATENTAVVKGLLEDLVERGLNAQRRYLVVIDGSKALRAGAERVFGNRAEVQRCQFHKRQNVQEHLPENCQADYDGRIRNAYAMTNYADAQAAVEKIVRQLEGINPSAARSLDEGLEEKELLREEFRREVERYLTGKETEAWEILYFKLYKSQLPVVEKALETAALMLGTDKSRGYCPEMICADFLAGANLRENRL